MNVVRVAVRRRSIWPPFLPCSNVYPLNFQMGSYMVDDSRLCVKRGKREGASGFRGETILPPENVARTRFKTIISTRKEKNLPPSSDAPVESPHLTRTS